MPDPNDTTQEPNSQTTTDQSAPKGDAPAPDSSDTTSSTTESQPNDDGSLLNPKPGEGDDASGADDGKEGDDAANGGDDANTADLFGAPADDAAYEITGLPEGVTIDTAALEAVTPLARELNLSNAGLSKLATVYTESVLPGVVAQIEKQATDNINADVAEMRRGWLEEARTMVQGGKAEDGTVIAPDKAFQGKPMKEVQQIAAKAIDKLAGPDFRQWADENGLGNHPALLRFAFSAGMAISEDTNFETGVTGASQPKTREEKYYG